MVAVLATRFFLRTGHSQIINKSYSLRLRSLFATEKVWIVGVCQPLPETRSISVPLGAAAYALNPRYVRGDNFFILGIKFCEL